MATAGTYTNGRGADHDWQPHELRGTNAPDSAFHTQEPMPDYRDDGKAADRTAPRFSEDDLERILRTALHEYRAMAGGPAPLAPGARRIRIAPAFRELVRVLYVRGGQVFLWSGALACGFAGGFYIVAKAVGV